MMTRKVVSVILGVLMIIAGVYCFFTPVETSTVIPFVLGIVMIGDGIGRIVTWYDIRDIVRQSAWVLVSAVVSLIFGLMLAFSPVLQMSVGVFVILLTGWWILALGIIRIVHAFHLLKIKRESDGFGFGEMIGSNWIRLRRNDRIQLVDCINPWNPPGYLRHHRHPQSYTWSWRNWCTCWLQRYHSRRQPDLSGLQSLASLRILFKN